MPFHCRLSCSIYQPWKLLVTASIDGSEKLTQEEIVIRQLLDQGVKVEIETGPDGEHSVEIIDGLSDGSEYVEDSDESGEYSDGMAG